MGRKRDARGQKSRGRSNTWLVILVVLPSIIIALALLLNWWPLLRGGFGWRWPYEAPVLSALPRTLPLLLGLALYLGGLHFLRQRRAWLTVGWCVLGATVLPLTVLYWLGDPLFLLFTRTVSSLTTGGFTVASRVENLSDTLREWPALMPTFESFSGHMTVSPPGWVGLYYLAGQALEKLPFVSRPLAMILRPMQCDDVSLMQLSNGQLASSWLGIVAPFWAALTVIPLYDIGRRMDGDAVGRLAIAWWPLVPSLSLFTATLSTPYPLGAVAIFWLFLLGLQNANGKRRALPLVAAGALTGLLLLFTFAWFPLILFLGLFALLSEYRSGAGVLRLAFGRAVLVGLQFGIGLLIVLALYSLLVGHTPLAIFQQSMAYHLQLERPYLPWLFLHLWDFALFLGLPVFLLTMFGSFRITEGLIRTTAISLALTIAITVLSGSARGETGRIWLFFMPFALLVVAQIARRLPARSRRMLLLSQVAWLLVLTLVLRTVSSGLEPPPALADVALQEISGPEVVTNADFGGLWQLQGFSGQIKRAPDEVVVDLFWQLSQPIERPYFFSAVLVSPGGEAVSSVTWQPFDYQFPTTCWYAAVGRGQITDRVVIPLAEIDELGDYWLSLRVFDLPEDDQPQYLPVTLPQGDVSDQMGLGPIR